MDEHTAQLAAAHHAQRHRPGAWPDACPGLDVDSVRVRQKRRAHAHKPASPSASPVTGKSCARAARVCSAR